MSNSGPNGNGVYTDPDAGHRLPHFPPEPTASARLLPARPPRLSDIGQSTVAQITLAKSLFQRGRHRQALDMLETSLRQNPELAQVQLLKGLILAQRAEYEAACEALDLASRLDSESQQAWLALSYVRFELEQLGPALKAIDRGLRIDVKSANGQLLRGNILAAMDRHHEAISAYRLALLANPQLAIARNKLSFLLAETGDPEEAINQAFIALRLNPTNPNTRITLGNLCRKLGKFDEAIAEYREAAKLAEHAPQQGLSYEKLGEVFMELGQLIGATRMFQTAVRINPKQIQCHLHLARIHADMDSLKEAEQMAMAAVKIDPLYPDAIQLLDEIQTRIANPKISKIDELLPKTQSAVDHDGTASLGIPRDKHRIPVIAMRPPHELKLSRTDGDDEPGVFDRFGIYLHATAMKLIYIELCDELDAERSVSVGAAHEDGPHRSQVSPKLNESRATNPSRTESSREEPLEPGRTEM